MKSLKEKVSYINYTKKWIVIGHIILFILFLSALPMDSTFGIERIVATFILSFMITYGITLHFKKSIIVGILFTLLMGLLDSRGPFSDYIKSKDQPYNQFINKYAENFEIKPAGDLSEDKGNSYSTSKTEDVDTTNFKDEDLDKILDSDEKKSNNENEHLKKAGGGLEQLKDLLDMAKKESPYQDKDTTTYTPAQAQRATFHLIDTVKQLKETMSEMMPLMKAGNNLMELHKKMNGKLTQA
jgi:hypothetical protein